jgi:enoyl-CoA hydratase
VTVVRAERRDDVAVVSLDRPRANAFDPELIAALATALAEAEDAAAIVLTSAVPGMFSAGWDLRHLVGLERPPFEAFVRTYGDLVRRLFACGQPVVAALPGHAIAGGLIVAMAADERLAAAGKGEVGLSEVLLGVSIPASLLEVFRHAVGPRGMERLAATGENLSMERALDFGLVDDVLPSGELLDAAVSRAAFLGRRPRAAYAAIKRRSRAAALARFDQARTGDGFADLWFSDDAQTRIRGLVEKLTKKS